MCFEWLTNRLAFEIRNRRRPMPQPRIDGSRNEEPSQPGLVTCALCKKHQCWTATSDVHVGLNAALPLNIGLMRQTGAIVQRTGCYGLAPRAAQIPLHVLGATASALGLETSIRGVGIGVQNIADGYGYGGGRVERSVDCPTTSYGCHSQTTVTYLRYAMPSVPH